MGMCLFEWDLRLVASEGLEVLDPTDLDFRCVPVGVTKAPGVVYDPGGVGGRAGLVRRRRLDEVMHHPLELATEVRERQVGQGAPFHTARGGRRCSPARSRCSSRNAPGRPRLPRPRQRPSSRWWCVPLPVWAPRLRCRAQRGNGKARTAREISLSAPAGQSGGHPPPLCTPGPFSGGRSVRTTGSAAPALRPAFELLVLTAARFARAALELEVHQVAGPGCGVALG